MGRVDLTTMLGDRLFTSPVMTASGCAGNGRELARFCDLAAVGAFVTASVTREGSAGSPLPRVLETPGGLLSAAGLPGGGIDAFLATELPWLLQRDARPIVSVAGTTLGEYAELARRVGNTPGIAGIEVNLAPVWTRDPIQAARSVSVVRRDTAAGVPVFAKLWPAAAPVADLAAAVLQAGADAVVLSGSLPGLALDAATLMPRLGAVTGELCGPSLLTVGLHAVWEVRRALPDACIIGVGGIRSGADVLHYLAAGADAVQVGTAIFADPVTPLRVADELRPLLAAHGLTSPAQARGLAHAAGAPRGEPKP